MTTFRDMTASEAEDLAGDLIEAARKLRARER